MTDQSPGADEIEAVARASNAQLLLQLAQRCERERPSTSLDIAINLVIAGRELPTLMFTASVDAALMLVPEGCSWTVRFRSHYNYAVDVGEDWATRHPGKHSANVWRMANRGLYDIHEHGTAYTIPLALCAASLKARSEEGPVSVEEQVRSIKRATWTPSTEEQPERIEDAAEKEL